ncbi:MAG: sigma-70 family RNA polymerase sigma factor [Planctomycetes bacterium]|nr:sigma-70 family RNA polymerase sigma factor [Planctomycetota bacterium]
MTHPPGHEIARLQAMDEAAWTRLQDEYFRRIYFFVKRYVGTRETAEDLTQEVFLGAVKGIGTFDPNYTLEQFLFGIARNRVIDHFRRHRITLLPAKADEDGDRSGIWIENLQDSGACAPSHDVVEKENLGRRRAVLGKILKEFVGELWQEGEFQKLQVLEYLFVLGGRNKDAARRFGISDEKAVAGIKFRAVERLRGLARQNDPNHSLFRGLWEPGAR